MTVIVNIISILCHIRSRHEGGDTSLSGICRDLAGVREIRRGRVNFLETDQSLASFEARWGHSYRVDALPGDWVFTPFAVLAGAYDSTLAERATAGAGLGLNLRSWFREDVYRAPMSFFDLSMQYRFLLGGDERSEGFFLTGSLVY